MVPCAYLLTPLVGCPTPQITSEQIVREAKELQEKDFKAPTQIITNETELGEYRLRKRKEYEDTLRMKRWNLNWWMRVGAAPRKPAWGNLSATRPHSVFFRQDAFARVNTVTARCSNHHHNALQYGHGRRTGGLFGKVAMQRLTRKR